MAFFAPALILGSISLGYGIYSWLSSGTKVVTTTEQNRPVTATTPVATTSPATKLDKIVSSQSVQSSQTSQSITIVEPEVVIAAQPVVDNILLESSPEVLVTLPGTKPVGDNIKPVRDIYIPVSVQQEFYERYRNVIGEISARYVKSHKTSPQIRLAAIPPTNLRIRDLRARPETKHMARSILESVQAFNKRSLKSASQRKLAAKTQISLEDQLKTAVQQRFHDAMSG